METVNGIATFTVSNLPPEGVDCTATETVPDGYALATSDCDAIYLPAEGGTTHSCTVSNRPTEAMLTVGKSFSDGNPGAGVTVTPGCTNGALITSVSPADAIAYENTDVNFTVRYFTPGAVCTAIETPVAGYSPGVAADDCASDQPISDGGGDNACEFYNIQNPATVTVYKTYSQSGSTNPDVEITLTCPGAIITSTNPVMTTNGVVVFAVQDFPWSGENCVATEMEPDGYVQVESIGCDSLRVVPGGPLPQCTIENAPVAAPIATLSQYGLMLLTLLMLGAGLVGFRRFA